MIDYVFYILLALTALQPGHGDVQVELYSDGQLRYRSIAQPTEAGYTLSVVDSELNLRQVAWVKRDGKGFEVIDEGAEEPRRIDLFEEIPGWTEQATSGESFSVKVGGDVIHGTRTGAKLTLSMNSDIDTVVIQPHED